MAALPDIDAAPTRQRARATGTDNATVVGVDNAKITDTDNVAAVSTNSVTDRGANNVSTTAVGTGYAQVSALTPTAAGIDENDDSVLAMRLALPGGKSRILTNRNGLNHMDATDAKTPGNIEKNQRLQGILTKTALREVGLEPTTYALKEQCEISGTDDETETYDMSPAAFGRALGAFAEKVAPVDPALAAVLSAWETLPEAVRAGIAAIVKATPAR